MSLLAGLFSRPEHRSTYANPAQWFIDWATGGGPTASGISVNEDSALKLSTVYACTYAIASDVAKLPLLVYRRLATGGKERAESHPAYWRLHVQPNPQMTAISMRSAMTAHMLNWGNAYAWIEWSGSGNLLYLWPLRPDRVKPFRREGRIWYEVKYFDDVEHTLVSTIHDAEDILHVPGLGFDGLTGYSVIQYAKESIGTAKAAERFGARFFGNGARPGGVLEHPGALSDQARANLRISWDRLHQGPDNAQRMAILEEGMKYNPISVNPDDAQFIETRQFSVSEVCRWYRMPPRKVGDTTRAQGWSTLEASNTEYVQDTLLPWLIRWEQAINVRIFGERAQGRIFAEHLVEGLLRGDTTSRASFYASGITNGWLTRNEVRELENRNPLPGLDEPLTPVAAAKKDEDKPPDDDKPKPGDKPFPPDDEDEDDRGAPHAPADMRTVAAAWRPVWEDTARRMIRKECNAISRAFNRNPQPSAFMDWARKWYADHEPAFRVAFAPAVDGLGEAVMAAAGRGTDSVELAERMGTFTADLAARHCASAVREIAGETAANIALLMDNWRDEGPLYLASVELDAELDLLGELLETGHAYAKAG
ncbi:MAG TPA: phage portal protein [Phycisphaerae bacterium]|nr:phage portal protein [Phycisphaerae bacterium]